ncbi:MAG: energy-coupling factor transporter ATPase [Coprothermobacter sp.]|nr:energy-coupling factor transporter ATPase [Coprothermobacter sp.]
MAIKQREPAQSDYVIELEDVSLSYDYGTPWQVDAVKPLSLRIAKGEWIALVGHTGSGKSSLAQLMAGLTAPTKGTVKHFGKPWNYPKDLSIDVRRRIGFLFQFPEHQFFAETVYDEVAFAAKNFELDSIEERVKKSLDIAGLSFDEFKDRSPFTLSGGEKRKVALASVIVCDPEVLILDEPSAGLDGASKKAFWDWLRSYSNSQRTVIFITHSLEEAVAAERVLVLSNGALLFADVPREVFSHVNTLRRVGLEPPISAELSYELRKGVSFPMALTVGELIRALDGDF